jgi:hypothetical protein
MGVLTPIVEIAALALFHPRQRLTFGGTVAFQLIRDEHAWHIPQALEPLAKELRGGLRVPPALHQEVEDVGIRIHGSPQVMTLALAGQTHLIERPRVAEPWPSAPAPLGLLLPER